MFGGKFSSSTSCSRWLHETEIGRPDPSLSCLFLKVATHPNKTSLTVFKPGKITDFIWETDLHFFLGTTQQFNQFAPNPWVIVGVFPVPYDLQEAFF